MSELADGAPGRHPAGGSDDRVALFYEDQAKQLATVASFIERGLTRDERCLYVADDNTPAAVCTALRTGDTDPGTAREAGQLSLHTAAELSLGRGEFDRAATVAFWADTLDRTRAQGFDGLRVAIEMTWVLDSETTADAIADCAAVLESLAASPDTTVLSQYSRERFPSDVVSAVARTRPLLAGDGTVRAERPRSTRTDQEIAVGAGQQSEPPVVPATADRPVRVLLVDDEPGYAEAVSEFLEKHDGIDEVVPESDPHEALAALDGTVDCIVSDYAMPGLDGLELLASVRERRPNLPFVLLTGQSREETAVEAISAGVTEYVRKQSGTEQFTRLAHRVSNVVRQYRAEQSAEAIKRQYTRLIEESSDVVTVLDSDGRFRYLSPAVERRLGYPAAELLGRPLLEFVHPADRDAAAHQLATLTDESSRSVSVEVRFEQPDGSWRWIEARGRNLLDDPDVNGLVMHARDITDRREREQQLRESEQRFRSLFEKAFDAMVLTDDEGACVDVNPAACELFDRPREALLDWPLADLFPADRGFDWPWQATQTPDRHRGTLGLRTATGDSRTVECAATPDVVPGRHLLVIRDVTDRERYEQTLTALHDSSRTLLGAESKTEVAESVVNTATDVLSMSVVAVYLLDAETGLLAPAAVSSETVDGSSLSALPPGQHNALGETFLDGEPRTVAAEEATTSPPDLPLDGEFLVPLGNHGVCVIGDTDSAVTDVGRELVETLVATAGTALDRVERGSKLQERKTELEAQNRQLEQLRQLNATVRDIGRAIVQADTRAAIETEVCTHLSAADGIALVRLTGHDRESGQPVPRESAGSDRTTGYLDAVSSPDEDPTEPAVRTAATGERVYVGNTADSLHEEPWRKTALAHEIRAVLSLPLAYRDISYGTLTVYAERADFFDELSRLALLDLSNKIASVTNAVEHQHALLSETMTEVTVRLTDDRVPMYVIASRAECSLTSEKVTSRSGEDTGTQVRIEGADVQTVTEIAEKTAAVSEVSPVTDAGENPLVELQCTNKPLTDYVADRGIRVLESTADPESATFTLSVPGTVDLREFFGNLSERYGDPELVAKSERANSTTGPVEGYRSQLTPRQREVLRTAHVSGFFESPRAATGETVADELGISPQTFYRHIRSAEAKLFDTVFEHGGE
jgi:PAS domain S-box-containing protein